MMTDEHSYTQVAADILNNTASLVSISQLGETVEKIVSLCEKLAAALRYVVYTLLAVIHTPNIPLYTDHLP